ncbi:formate dehydrogenase subunit alpha [Dictyobacter sp. S3.2.2.5]|uniref:Formate dehydrogenase subunit alpha n=1 Tax=Dictyobacter halimunensis TaxID=3026934 RepID=A0ABQ6G1E1_9CHLR|nr:formate dehydrogenase subunit alpha [Dictyobacter sp. S3.2.2.5]
MPGLGASVGRGTATTCLQDMPNSDCILIIGSNFAESHPVGFRHIVQAKEKGAKIIHIDPHFSRTSQFADLYAPIRVGTDIAFMGGLINYVLQNELYFKEYVEAYTNATYMVGDDYRDAEDLEGVFSGLDEEHLMYDTKSWQYKMSEEGEQRKPAGDYASTVGPSKGSKSEHVTPEGQEGQGTFPQLHPSQVAKDPSMQNPRCVMQILRRHFARYTPEMVEQVCGISQDIFLKIAETFARNSGRERTACLAYSVGWTQHTVGVQMIRTSGILQLLLGNMGRPGGGVLALRGHANIQGSTDIPTLYNLLPGYLTMPSALREEYDYQKYMENNYNEAGWWEHYPDYFVSLMKAWYGDAATKENDWAYDYLPKVTGDFSDLAMFVNMKDGGMKGFFLLGQNPAAGGVNAGFHRAAMEKLDWLVVRDLYEIESASYWKRPGVDPKNIPTEVIFLPAASHVEKEGSFVNTQRLIQYREKAVDPPDDARSENWFMAELYERLQEYYKDSTKPRDLPVNNLNWPYRREESGQREPIVDDIVKEINGYTVRDGHVVKGFNELRRDGTTACGAWIFSGIMPEEGNNLSKRREKGEYPNLNWCFTWPANRHILYNRASADPEGKPWSERKRYVWWDGSRGRWTGVDIPDFPEGKSPDAPADPGGIELKAHSGASPFTMNTEGVGRLFTPTGIGDGPLPTHYEPVESPVRNMLYPRYQSNPIVKYWRRPDNPDNGPVNPDFPYAITTNRLTEHHVSGAMSRQVPWLSELQPSFFAEISPALAEIHGVKNADWITIWTKRGEVEARALVTDRIRPLHVAGQTVHQIILPFHWAFEGVVKGDVANDLLLLVADPNVSMHDAKSFSCNMRAGRRAHQGEDGSIVAREFAEHRIEGA